MEDVAALLADPGVAGTVWVIVGDHPPPFPREEHRRLFVDGKVPAAVIEPREPAGKR